ncbi:hypothetical protein [Actinomycetospora aeridis]|uniref:Aldehyde dehydrogenase family protein n=1 Tax=Actinomycetospora aeridis TaxID=3129231 RepID=A0ABU8NDP2_9PSEU
MAIATTNPATGETVREFDALPESPFGGGSASPQDADEKLRSANEVAKTIWFQ